MRPNPIKPHVACRLWELEKHLRVLWHAAVGVDLRRGEASAESVRIVWLWSEEGYLYSCVSQRVAESGWKRSPHSWIAFSRGRGPKQQLWEHSLQQRPYVGLTA
jgi:hypothetical protein